MTSVVKKVCPKKKGNFEKTSLSARIVTQRGTEELAEDVKETFRDSVNNFQYYSVALDLSVDVKVTDN